MSDEEQPEWSRHMHINDRVIIEYETYRDIGNLRGGPKIFEGRVHEIRQECIFLDLDNPTLVESMNPYFGIRYERILRLKNLDTNYDSGEAHE